VPALKVIGDLKVRLYEAWAEPPGPFGSSTRAAAYSFPLFRINTVDVRKGFSVLTSNTPGQVEVWNTYPVDPVPPVNIPAWTQVQHNHFTLPTPTWNVVTDALETGNTTNLQTEEAGYFGDNYLAQTITAPVENNDVSLAPNNTIN